MSQNTCAFDRITGALLARSTQLHKPPPL